MELKDALAELRKTNEKRKFDQSVDFIINLRGIDLKRDNLSVVISLPHKIKEKTVCAFLTKKSELVTTITPADFIRFKDKTALKNIVKKYDFFIAAAPLMAQVATIFGKALGPSGKMPSPQLGVIMVENDDNIKATMKKISTSLKIRMKEPSFKIISGKESMKDEDILSNIDAIYQVIANALPKKKENIKSCMVKFTMSKPVKVEMK